MIFEGLFVKYEEIRNERKRKLTRDEWTTLALMIMTIVSFVYFLYCFEKDIHKTLLTIGFAVLLLILLTIKDQNYFRRNKTKIFEAYKQKTLEKMKEMLQESNCYTA